MTERAATPVKTLDVTLDAGPPAMHASLQSRRNPAARAGPERIALLQAIRTLGSISAAAKSVGLSYKGAWDAVQALNNLFETPLVTSQTGGRQGGAAQVTPAGEAVLRAFSRVETALADVATQLDEALGDAGTSSGALIWGLGMKTTARNLWRGVVETISDGAVNAEVRLRISPDITLVAIVTTESVTELGLAPGRSAIAMVNASSIILTDAEATLRTSARNSLTGMVTRHEKGAVNDEITLELAPGKTLVATITQQSAEDLGLGPGKPATALIKASHVILAVD